MVTKNVGLFLIQLGNTTAQLCCYCFHACHKNCVMLGIQMVLNLVVSCDVYITVSCVRERKQIAVVCHRQLFEIAPILSSQLKLFILQLCCKLQFMSAFLWEQEEHSQLPHSFLQSGLITILNFFSCGYYEGTIKLVNY